MVIYKKNNFIYNPSINIPKSQYLYIKMKP